jgi:anti-anti-sigma factor
MGSPFPPRAMTYIGIQERRSGDVSILDVDAQIRIGLRFGASAVPLTKAIQGLLDEGRDQILLNLQRVRSIDARGLAEIVSAASATKQKGGRCKLLLLNERVQELMSKAGVLTSFEVFEVEWRAVKSFTAEPIAPNNDRERRGGYWELETKHES